MIGFIIRRILWTVPVVLLASFLTFALVKAVPYEKDAFNNPKYSADQRAAIRSLYGLDKPYLVQYKDFVVDLFQGELGVSTKSDATAISDIVKLRLPVSMKLGLMAFILSAAVGITLGVLSALKANGPIDYFITIFSTLAFAVPSFTTAVLWVKYVQVYGWDMWSERIGPVAVLAFSIMPYFVRLVRASMLEALQQEYVVTSRAKGMPWRTTVVRHALRNSLIPTVVNAGPLLGFILTGSFVIERIMVVPGIAGQFVDSFTAPMDNRLILVTTVLLATIIILANLLVDVIVGWLDPRISHD